MSSFPKDRLTEISEPLQDFFRATPWTPKTKKDARSWFLANVSKVPQEWHQAWDDVVLMLYKTPSKKYMWNYDELAEIEPAPNRSQKVTHIREI